MLSIEEPQPRSQEPIHSFTLNAFIRTSSPPNRKAQHVFWSALCSNYRNEVCMTSTLNVTEAEFDRYSGWLRCAVTANHSPRPLWLTNTLHSDRQIWLPQKLGRSIPHIQSARERGSRDVEQREQYRHGPIPTATLHLSTPPPPPDSACYQFPTTRSPNKTTLIFSNTHTQSPELIYNLETLVSNGSYFYTTYLFNPTIIYINNSFPLSNNTLYTYILLRVSNTIALHTICKFYILKK